MGAFIDGQFIRVRWRPLGPALRAVLTHPDTTAIQCDRLLEGAEQTWGLITCQGARLIGEDVPRDIDADVPLRPDPQLPEETGPAATQAWLVGVQTASHCWASLPSDQCVTPSDVTITWHRLALPGTEDLILGRPWLAGQPARLVYPPPYEAELQADLAPDGMTLLPPPPLRESDPYRDPAIYRYGLYQNGEMNWLDIAPGLRSYPVRPATAAFRAKLAELKAALATRGVFYTDAPDEVGHHRLTFEDAYYDIPPDFGDDPPVAYSVSGVYDNEDKADRAAALFIPDGDEVLRYDRDRIGFLTLPSERDVTQVNIIYVGGTIVTKTDAGIRRSQRWTGWSICDAAHAVGLQVRWYGSPDASITVAMPGAFAQESLEAPALDSETFTQLFRRIGLAIATVARAGLEGAAANGVMAEAEVELERILRLQNALHLAEQNRWSEAFGASALVQEEGRAEWARPYPSSPMPLPQLPLSPIRLRFRWRFICVGSRPRGTARERRSKHCQQRAPLGTVTAPPKSSSGKATDGTPTILALSSRVAKSNRK